MNECLRLARRGLGNVSPNPMVGAVIVKRNHIAARGFHRFFGGPHAEVECLRRFRGNPRGARLFVNLEPCAHQGKTPPCADLIIRSGIRKVIIGMKDPNPIVAGRGIRLLQRSGIRTTVGILEKECRELNETFVRHITTGLPFIHLKIAQTFDGKIAGPKGTSGWISSPASRRLVHKWRATHDAVLVGAQTVISDDPQLNVRLSQGRNPHVVIVDGELRAPLAARALRRLNGRRVFLCTSEVAIRKKSRTIGKLKESGVEVLSFPGEKTRISLRKVIKELYRRNIGSILVEGGADVASGFLYGGLVDRLSVFIAPRVMGPGLPGFGNPQPGIKRRSRRLKNFTLQRVGNDLLLQYDFH